MFSAFIWEREFDRCLAEIEPTRSKQPNCYFRSKTDYGRTFRVAQGILALRGFRGRTMISLSDLSYGAGSGHLLHVRKERR